VVGQVEGAGPRKSRLASDDRLYEALLEGGAPLGYREVVEAVNRKDLAALRAEALDGPGDPSRRRAQRGRERPCGGPSAGVRIGLVDAGFRRARHRT